MKRKITIALLLGIVLSVNSFANVETTPQVAVEGSVPLRISVWPGVKYWPKGMNVYGMSFGAPISLSKGEPVYGIDLALLMARTTNVKGAQISLFNDSSDNMGLQAGIFNNIDNFKGIQAGAVNLNEGSIGAQVGLCNQANNGSVNLQVGVINKTSESYGIQIGILNMMDNGFLPIFPIINFSIPLFK